LIGLRAKVAIFTRLRAPIDSERLFFGPRTKDHAMSTLATVTITDQGQTGKAQETQLIHDALNKVAHDLRSMKTATSGNIILAGGVNVGTWTYTGTGGNN
jgi:hypothetical protein